MTEAMDQMTEALSPETPARRVRLTMGTMMIGVLTAAVASALFAELRQLIKTPQSLALQVDVPTIVLLGISLNAVALGCWRKLTVEQVLAQIAICCFLILVGAWIWDAKLTRVLRYWLQLSFGVAFVLPLLVQTVVGGDARNSPRNPWLISSLNNVMLAYVNFVVVLLVAVFQTIIILLMNMF